MTRAIIHTNRAPAPGGHYSQAISCQGLVFTAGMVGIDPATGRVVEGGIGPQVMQTLENIRAVLHEAGTSLDKVVKENVYLLRIADFEAFNEVYSRYFGNTPPARTTVEVGSFLGDVAVEIDVIAELRHQQHGTSGVS